MAHEITIRGRKYSLEYYDCAGYGGPKAEAAYRQAYLAAAEEAAKWQFPDLKSIEAAWRERRKAAKQAEKRVAFTRGSSDVRLVYKRGHEIEAARHRGRVQALEFAKQAWWHLSNIGFINEEIQQEFMQPWPDLVRKWVALPLEKSIQPPRPGEMVTKYQWSLILSKHPYTLKSVKSLEDAEEYLRNRYGPWRHAWGYCDENRNGLGYAYVWQSSLNRVLICYAARLGNSWYALGDEDQAVRGRLVMRNLATVPVKESA